MMVYKNDEKLTCSKKKRTFSEQCVKKAENKVFLKPNIVPYATSTKSNAILKRCD